MALTPGTAYYYLNQANEITMRIEWEAGNSNFVYIRPNGTQAPAANYQPSGLNATSFLLYGDASLAQYRYQGADGTFQKLDYAHASPGTAKTFGPNNAYTVGEMTSSDVLLVNQDGAKYQETKGFSGGNLTYYSLNKISTPSNPSAFVLVGSSSNGSSTLTLSGAGNASPIGISGQGFLNSVIRLDIARLVGQDGASLISENGLGLVGQDGASLIGNDAGSLAQLSIASIIGNDAGSFITDQGGGLLNLNGGAASVLSPAYALQSGRLVGQDGASLIGQDGASFAGNAMSMMRGYSLLSETSFTPPPQTDGVDASTGGEGNDILRGGRGGDVIEGGAGNDILYGNDSNLIRNGSFENIYQPSFDGGYDILTRPLDGWTLASGASIELFITGPAGVPSAGRYGIDLEGDQAGANIAISQVVKEAIDGQSYRVAFDVRKVSANASARLEVSWGGVKLSPTAGGVQYIDPTTSTTTYYLTVVGGAGSGANKNLLTFREIGGADYFGTLLDNVRMFRDTPGSLNAKDPAVDGGDAFIPGTGSDAVFGHFGDDVAVFDDVGPGLDHYNGGSGTDLLSLDWSAANGAITFADFYTGTTANISARIGLAQSYSLAATFGQSAQTLYFNEVERFILKGGSNADVFEGGELADTLIGNGGADFLRGGGGADSITGGTGKDTLVGGTGDDVFFLAAGDEASGESIGGGSDTDEIRTASATLDLRGMLLSGIESIRTTHATGTAFTVGDASHIPLLRGGSGASDSVNAVGMTLTSAQRTALYDNGIESVTDQTGTYTRTTSPAGSPTITGLVNQTINDTGVTNPFGGVSVGDPNGDLVTATVTISNTANGLFTTSSLTSAGFTATAVAGQYMSARTSLSAVSNGLRALVFDPTNNQAAAGVTTTTTFGLTVNDGNGGVVSGSSTVGVLSANDAPVITSNGGGVSAFLTVQENTTSVTRVVAADPDPGPLTYSLVTGGDAAKFSIDPSSGLLTFIAPPDFEQPGSSNASNFYYVAVRATDGSSALDEQTLGITVTDQNYFPGTTGNERIEADNGADTVVGGFGDDTLLGGPGADTMYGDIGPSGTQGGNDVLNGGLGNDTLHGDIGIDVARYGIASTAATWTRTGTGWTVNAGAEGIDRLTGIEILRFSDRDVRLGTVENDFGGDGRADILWRNDSGALSVWTSTGTGFTGRDYGIVPTSWTVADTADFGGDGKADLLWRNANGAVNLWTSGDTTFATRDLGVVPTAWKIQGADDVTGDGRADLLWRHDDGSLNVWIGTGTSFTSQDFGKLALGWTLQETGDMNADGKADLFWRHDDGTLNVWTSTGSSFASNGFGVVPTSWHIADVADVNGDARADIVWRNDSGALNVWTSTGTGFAGHDFGIVGNDWTLERAQDVSGDGRADILWRNDNGTLNVWTSTGTSFTGHDHGVIDPSWHIV